MCPGSCHGSQCTGRLGKAHDSAVTIFQQTGPQNSLGSCHCAYPALSFHVFPLSLPQEVILGTRTPHCTWRQRGVGWGQRGKEPEATSGATAPEICRPVLRPASPVTAASGSASVTTALASRCPRRLTWTRVLRTCPPSPPAMAVRSLLGCSMALSFPGPCCHSALS